MINQFCSRFNLTRREKEILLKVFEGKAVKEIGNELFITAGTAKNHIQNILFKTNTHSRIELFSLFFKFYQAAA